MLFSKSFIFHPFKNFVWEWNYIWYKWVTVLKQVSKVFMYVPSTTVKYFKLFIHRLFLCKVLKIFLHRLLGDLPTAVLRHYLLIPLIEVPLFTKCWTTCKRCYQPTTMTYANTATRSHHDHQSMSILFQQKSFQFLLQYMKSNTVSRWTTK